MSHIAPKWPGWLTKQEYLRQGLTSGCLRGATDWHEFFEVIKKEYPDWCYVDFGCSRGDAIHWEALLQQWWQELSSEQNGSQPAAPTFGEDSKFEWVMVDSWVVVPLSFP